MGFSSRHHLLPITFVFVSFFLIFSSVFATRDFTYIRQDNQTFQLDNELKTKLIKDRLTNINKPFVKSIKSPDGDIIDCVLIHLQPAFDHPKLKGTIPLDPPEKPNGKKVDMDGEINQLWSSKGDSCPNGTIPIRRTSEDDIFRSISISKFGKKSSIGAISDGHEHALGYVSGEKYYGAKAKLNVWGPNVNQNEFSLSQIWVITHTSTHDSNTVEAGWQVYPKFYKDNSPRFFTFWTNDGYRSGCYNLLCPGFVQINKNIALGAVLSPTATYNGPQFDITVLIWKDPNSGDWWLNLGNDTIGYWPRTLFPDLRDHATLVEFGGEVVNSQASGPHTSTQMGSGHFPDEGFGKASFVRNMEVVDEHNKLIPASNVNLYAEKPNCYDVRKGFDDVWGNYVFFGGPGNNLNCP